ncbi:hypothetical protein GGQ87_000709 [Brevundimonas alba]|uniref:Lectin-like protein BA14k n=1 Tax=Brevundimonas alba TaxID=74314 RepID=A0A7X5YI91_9CAUL|nr:BA14K family protein [Brevundimonas alba]NJC40451.1 hypothetical protein [Brevundimonas alba]
MKRPILVTTAVFAALALPAAAQVAGGQPQQAPATAPQGTDRTPPADTENRSAAPGPAAPRNQGTPYHMPASGGPENPSGGAAAMAQPGGASSSARSGGSAGAMAGRSMDYGMWESSWGARPPAPPSGFANPSDWHRHVRACQQRYKTYNPSTDMYVPRVGSTARCSR